MDIQLDMDIRRQTMNVVIKFSGNFCNPCQQLKPIFDDVIKDIPDIKVVEIDVE